MQYVHQCMTVAEKAALALTNSALSDKAVVKPSVRTDWIRPEEIETKKTVNAMPALEPRVPSEQPQAQAKIAPAPAVAPDNRRDPMDDAPVRKIESLPRANASDANEGRDVSAPMIEDWRWTVRLVEHGYRLGECALVRGKTPDAILDDLTKALQDGKRFSIDNLFDRRTQIAVKEMRDSAIPLSSPPPIFQSYPSLWRFIQRWLDA